MGWSPDRVWMVVALVSAIFSLIALIATVVCVLFGAEKAKKPYDVTDVIRECIQFGFFVALSMYIHSKL